MTASHVLVIHSEPAAGELVAAAAGRDDVRVSLASSAADGLAVLKKEQVHLLVADWDTLRIGYDFVRQAATIHPLLRVVLIADAATVDNMSKGTEDGPIQYLRRPVTRQALWSAIDKALHRQVRSELPRGPAMPAASATALAAAAANGRGESGIERRMVATSKAMRDLLALVRKCAPTEACVLISGEPDTGKEMLAREIHRQSNRAAGPFVRVACAALREADLAASLFGPPLAGREQTAAAGPTLLEQASGGTLFLENVSALPPSVQADLLEVLQQGMLHRGSGGEIAAVNVRVIASTTEDLHQAVARGTFLAGLYYALNVLEMHVPPLRHRRQDIAPLAETCLAAANAARVVRGDRRPCRLSEEAMQCLLEYDWPGNTAQLASVLTHAVLLADEEQLGRAEIASLLGAATPQRGSDTISVPLVGGLREMERSIIGAVIDRCRGNKAAAARALGLHRRTLYRILQDDAAAKKGPALPLGLDPAAGDFAVGAYA